MKLSPATADGAFDGVENLGAAVGANGGEDVFAGDRGGGAWLFEAILGGGTLDVETVLRAGG